MVLLFTIITLAMGVSMFFISRARKIAIMFIGCMTLSLLRMDIPILTTADFFFVFCFLLSEIKNIKMMMIKIPNKTITSVFQILFISFFVSLLFSPHLHSIKELTIFLRKEFLLKYFALIYAFYAVKNETNIQTIIRYSIIPFLILTLFGIVNLIDGHSSFVSEMMSNWKSNSDVYELAGERYLGDRRYRVQAMFFNAFNYGYICVLCLLIYIYGYSKKMIKKTLFVILLVCCAFGILMCGARTVLFCSLIAVGIYLLLAYKLDKTISLVIVVLSSSIIAYMTIPAVNEKVEQMTTMFSDTEGREFGGSNLEMRSLQFATTLSYIQDTPLFGRGVGFFENEMGWKDGKAGLRDERFYGLEGVYMNYLLERGIVGYIMYLIVWILMIITLFFYRQHNKKLSAFGIAVWGLYTLFANMTGELSSVYPTLLVLGSILSVLNTNKRFYDIKNKIFNNHPRIQADLPERRH